MTEQFHPLKSVTGLGSMKSVHGFNNFFRNNRIIFSGMILAGIFSCMCLMMYGFMQDAKNGVQSDGIGFTLGVAASLILLSLFIIFWMMRDWLKNRKFSAALFDGGVATQNVDGRIESVSWQDIDYIKPIRLARRSPHYNYNLVCKDGRVVVLPHFLERQADLIRSVQHAVGAQG